MAGILDDTSSHPDATHYEDGLDGCKFLALDLNEINHIYLDLIICLNYTIKDKYAHLLNVLIQ